MARKYSSAPLGSGPSLGTTGDYSNYTDCERKISLGPPLIATKFLALCVASVLSMAVFDSHATVQLITSSDPASGFHEVAYDLDCDGVTDITSERVWDTTKPDFESGSLAFKYNESFMFINCPSDTSLIISYCPVASYDSVFGGHTEWSGDDAIHFLNFKTSNNQYGWIKLQNLNADPAIRTGEVVEWAYDTEGNALADGERRNEAVSGCPVATPVNNAPSFTKGADIEVDNTTAPQSVEGWATNLSKGPENESTQTLSFVVSTDATIFTTVPAIDANGNLTYTPNGTAGVATISVKIKDDGGTENGGVDESAPQTFTITVNRLVPK